jgi:hypothetical protein
MIKRAILTVISISMLFMIASLESNNMVSNRKKNLCTMLNMLKFFITPQKLKKIPKKTRAIIQKKVDNSASPFTIVTGMLCLLLIGLPCAGVMWKDTIDSTVCYAR